MSYWYSQMILVSCPSVVVTIHWQLLILAREFFDNALFQCSVSKSRSCKVLCLGFSVFYELYLSSKPIVYKWGLVHPRAETEFYVKLGTQNNIANVLVFFLLVSQSLKKQNNTIHKNRDNQPTNATISPTTHNFPSSLIQPTKVPQLQAIHFRNPRTKNISVVIGW